MRDPAGQAAEAFHLLLVPHASFQPQALFLRANAVGDVSQNDHGPPLVAEDAGDEFEWKRGPVTLLPRGEADVEPFAFQGFANLARLGGIGAAVAVEQVRRPCHDVFRRIAEYAPYRIGAHLDPAFRAHDHQHVRADTGNHVLEMDLAGRRQSPATEREQEQNGQPDEKTVDDRTAERQIGMRGEEAVEGIGEVDRQVDARDRQRDKHGEKHVPHRAVFARAIVDGTDPGVFHGLAYRRAGLCSSPRCGICKATRTRRRASTDFPPWRADCAVSQSAPNVQNRVEPQFATSYTVAGEIGTIHRR